MRTLWMIALLTSAVLAGPEDQAKRLLAKGDHEKALKAVQTVTKKDAQNIAAWIVYADVYAAMGELEEAWGVLQDDALTANPKSATLLIKLGDVFVELAKKKLKQGGAGLETQNFFLDAQRVYGEAVAFDAKATDAVYGDAYVNFWLGKPAEAKKSIAKALGMDPNHAKSHALQALLLYRAKKYPAAATSYETARKLDDSNADVCYYYGHALYGSGKTDEAREAYRYLLKRHPGDTRAISVGLKTVCRKDDAKFEAGLIEWSKSIKNSAPLWEYIGRATFSRKEYKPAIAAFKKATALAPKNDGYLFWLGFIEESRGDAQAAADYYTKTLKTNNTHVDAAYRYQNLIPQLSGGEFGNTEKLYEGLIKLAPTNGDIHNNFALALRNWAERAGARGTSPSKAAARRIKRSGEVYELAAALATDVPQVLSDTGLLFEFYPCNRDDDKAERYFRKSLEFSGFLYRDAFDGLSRLCRRTNNWEILKDYAEGVIEAIDGGGRARAPRAAGAVQDLTAPETSALRDRAKGALAEAERNLKSD